MLKFILLIIFSFFNSVSCYASPSFREQRDYTLAILGAVSAHSLNQDIFPFLASFFPSLTPFLNALSSSSSSSSSSTSSSSHSQDERNLELFALATENSAISQEFEILQENLIFLTDTDSSLENSDSNSQSILVTMSARNWSESRRSWVRGHTNFTLSLDEWLRLVELCPTFFRSVELDDHFHTPVLQLSPTMAYILVQYVRGNWHSVELMLRSLSPRQIDAYKQEAKKIRFSNFQNLFQQSHLHISSIDSISSALQKSKKRKKSVSSTGFSPKKPKTVRCISLDTPVKNILKGVRARVDSDPVSIVHSEASSYDSGLHAYISSLDPSSSFALNSEHPVIHSLVSEFLQENTDAITFEDLLKNIALFLHKNVRQIDSISVRDTEDEFDGNESVCRHFSLYSSILFSKIIKAYPSFSDSSKIHIISGYLLRVSNGVWKVNEDGGHHAWTMAVHTDPEGTPNYWFYDAYNHAFAKLTPNVTPNDIVVIDFENGDQKQILQEDHWAYPFIQVTLEKFIYQHLDSSPYNIGNQNKLEKISHDILSDLNRDEKLTRKPKVVKRLVLKPHTEF